MVVVPDADGQHEQIVQNVVDGGLKTLDPKRRTSEELDGICTENILQDVVDVEEIRKNVEKMNQENQEAEESDIERKLRLLAEKRRSGEIEREFRHLTAMNEMINIENVQELFAVKIGEFKHNFLTLQTPESTDEKAAFWRRVFKEKCSIVLQLNDTKSDYFFEGDVSPEFKISFRHNEKHDHA